jgi:uncharacterized glyoxalase superfamily protein PhnB
VTPYLSIDGGEAALEFYKKAFGARELVRQTTPDGKLMHGRIKIGDSIVMISDVFPGSDSAAPTKLGTSTVVLHIYAKDVDQLWERALAAGARVAMPLEETFWGERYGKLVDPFGHHWSLSQRVKMSKAEKQAKEAEAMAAFSQERHPAKEGERPSLLEGSSDFSA